MKIKIEFHYTYLIMVLGFVLTGSIKNVIILTSIIVIHELGHYLVAKLMGIGVSKIVIYPYGGITKIDDKINIDINKELLVAVSGVSFQSIYYYIVTRIHLVTPNSMELFKLYHYSILWFNLLPIYPLDGSKICNLIMSKIFPFKVSNILTVIISIVTILIFSSVEILFTLNYSYIMIFSILIYDIYKFYQELEYIYNKFLLERYLYNISYKDLKIIKKKESMYKNKRHIIGNKKEKDVLAKIFDKR
jgi:stage IV sporulation protein FB